MRCFSDARRRGCGSSCGIVSAPAGHVPEEPNTPYMKNTLPPRGALVLFRITYCDGYIIFSQTPLSTYHRSTDEMIDVIGPEVTTDEAQIPRCLDSPPKT